MSLVLLLCYLFGIRTDEIARGVFLITARDDVVIEVGWSPAVAAAN